MIQKGQSGQEQSPSSHGAVGASSPAKLQQLAASSEEFSLSSKQLKHVTDVALEETASPDDSKPTENTRAIVTRRRA